MDRMRKKVKALKETSFRKLHQEDLEGYGLQGIVLRQYQLDGVAWMNQCCQRGHGCVLGDEMGLGKTIQTISFLVLVNGCGKMTGPFLILSPLSVMRNWQIELERFAPKLKVLTFTGDKEQREGIKDSLRENIRSQGCGWMKAKLPFSVLLTTYEMCLKDSAFLSKFSWKVLTVDEAHRLKNPKSVLHQELSQFHREFSILLTGTPVQNNLKELYSLLSFVEPDIFEDDLSEDFVEAYTNVSVTSGKNTELQKLMSPFLLRRVKSEVMADLPRKSEVILYTGLSDLQKKYYKAILTKDLGAFSSEGPNKTRLMNILIQLRKCVNHPYLFDGVEPEPFELGDHLINASGKLLLIDQLLAFLKPRGHKVLMFSQMTRMLDIIQDYLGYRGYTYERLDGSVRGEERFLAIQNFNETEDTFIFLLSTRAGGQGLNLMSADTVIFVDSDFNPQNDLQAAARAHRIGQTRPVKVIRLVGRSTVEEIILKRADDKLKLTNTVIEGGQFSGTVSSVSQIAETKSQLADILKFGLDKLFDSEESAITEEGFQRILGASCDGEWTLEEEIDDTNDVAMETLEENEAGSMYVYEGRDYSKEQLDADWTAFDKLAADVIESVTTAERALRSEKTISVASLTDLPTRKRRVMTPEEIEQRRIKRQETLAKRAKMKEEEEVRKATERRKKLEKLWKKNSYDSLNISLKEDESEDESSEGEDFFSDETADRRRDIKYVRGDVTHPQDTDNHHAIIVHCVDDSGSWGQGGLFSALKRRSPKPEVNYELAGKMKDLSLGDAHLLPVDDVSRRENGRDYVALIVAQTRDRHQRLSGIKLPALSLGLQRVACAAKDMNATVHLPRIGHSTPNFNWYGTERLIRKHLAAKGITTAIYYYPRNNAGSSNRSSSRDTNETQSRKDKSPKSDRESRQEPKVLPDFLTGVTVYFAGISEESQKKLRRYVIAYNGDVELSCCSTVTHIVCNETSLPLAQADIPETGVLVSPAWLEDCIKNKRLLNTVAYEWT